MEKDNAIHIGMRHVWGGEKPFGLLPADRRYHTYIIGKTGSGKTTLLRNLILQDIVAGHGAQGNIIDFACRMENLDPARPDDVRKAALILADRYRIVSAPPKRSTTKKSVSRTSDKVIVNAPLDFTLKGLDPDHPYFREHGFTKATVDHFELGYASRGLMQGRIAIPLRNAEGKLIGYAGRVMDDSLITEDNPKCRFPTAREHDGKRYEFNKALLLYNGHAIEQPADELTVVSGFRSVWWLWQNGYPNVVALMGSSCSPQQASLIVGMTRRSARIRILSNSTQVDSYWAEDVLRQVAMYRFCKRIQLKTEQLTTQCGERELKELLT
jgi:hypothetical protein